MSTELVAAVAAFLGVGAVDVSKAVAESIRRLNTAAERRREKTRAAKLEKYVGEGTIAVLLRALYRDSLPASWLPVELALGDSIVETNVVAQTGFSTMSVRLGTDGEQCTVTSSPPIPRMRSASFSADSSIPSVSLREAAQMIASLNVRKRRVWDAPIYRLVRHGTDPQALRLDFAIDRFARYRLTVGALFDECVDALAAADDDVGRVLHERERLLPLRTRFLPTFAEFDLSKIICGGGATVAFAMARGAPFRDFVIPVQRRSDEVAAGQGQLSVCPQAIHQPMVSPDHESAISSTVFRELFEELFSGDEVERDVRRVRSDWYFKHEPLRWFREHADGYDLVATSFTRNLLNGNYECSVVLAVTDEEYWDKFSDDVRASWEADGIALYSTREANNRNGGVIKLLQEPAWTTESLVAFWRALEWLREHYPERTDDFGTTISG